MRSSVKALLCLAFAVLLLAGPANAGSLKRLRRASEDTQPSTSAVERLSDADKVAAEPELVEVDYDPEIDGYQNGLIVSREKLDKLKQAYADRTDIHPYFTRENIYSEKTDFEVYLEDDGDVHINVRIPGLRETIDVDTKLGAEAVNESGQDSLDELDVDKSEVDEVEDITEPPIVAVPNEKNKNIEAEDTDSLYSDPDSNNDEEESNLDVIVVPTETAEEKETRTNKDGVVVIVPDYIDPENNETPDSETNNESPKSSETSDRDEKTNVIVIPPGTPEYEDPELAGTDDSTDDEVSPIAPPPTDNQPNPTDPTITASENKDKTAAVKAEEAINKLTSNFQNVGKEGGLSLFWICAILFCCFV